MSEEMEKNLEGATAEQNQNTTPTEGSREGYRPSSGYQGYRQPGRSPRPRIHQATRPYSPRTTNAEDEGGFRPEGFGASLQQGEGAQRPYRPRNTYGQQGGYQARPQQGYQARPQQGYRPRYNAPEGEGGYQPRPQQGYQARPQQGYQPRPQQGYQPRPQQGYQPRGGYQARGGYGQPYGPQQGYQPRGGYGPQRPAYGKKRPNPNAKYSLKKRIEYKEVNVDPNEPIRLNKFLANAGICSRREADEFIQAGAVKVNGEVVTELGTKVMRTDEIFFHEAPVTLEKKVYVLLNKPKDYVTTSDDPQQRKTVMDLVKNVCPERIYPVGRLDRNTTGVLLLTNDGDLASKLTHPKFLKKKVYHVFLDKPVAPQDMQQIAEGVDLEDGEVHADAIEYSSETDKSQVGIEIHSGKNRIVRRIFEALGYRVVKLDRVLFAGLTKKNLRRGDWRFLTEKEVDMLRMGAFE